MGKRVHGHRLRTTLFPFDQNVVSVPEFSRRKLLPFLQKPNVFEGKMIENVPSIRLLTESPPALHDGS